MTPMEKVLAHYTLPFPPYLYQAETVNELAPKAKQGHYLAVGVGKTLTSTCCALFKFVENEIDAAIVLLPPILMIQWKKWLEACGVSVLLYRGTPKERNAMNLHSAKFIIMTYNIFKNDFDRLERNFKSERTAVICDEATAIKNISTQNYKHVRNFTMDGHLMLLTGTPLAKPDDAYAYVKLLAPDVYRNKNHFDQLHIEEFDFFGNPASYMNLELMNENMRINSVRILKEDVLDQLPEITYNPIHYELDKEHLALYKRLAEEQLLTLDDGSKIDATETTALWHKLQQIVCNFGFFAGDASKRSTCFELIDETMEELGDKKLIIFTHYRMTSEAVTAYCKKWGAVAVYGGLTRKQVDKNVEAFLDDPKCQIMVAQSVAGGYGWNPQEVCADVLFLEEPLVPIVFEQCVGRVYRNGQRNKVNVRVAVAQGTIQVHLNNILMKKDELVNKVVRSYQDLRKALYGTQH